MQTPDPTLHDFVLKLLSDAGSRAAFDLDPVHALSAAGLPDVTPQDVMDAVPLVMDFASASGEGFDAAGHAWGSQDEVGWRHVVASPFGSLAGDTEAGAAGIHNATWVDSEQGSGQFDIKAGPSGVEGSGWFDSPLGKGSYAFAGGLDGFDGNVHLPGMDLDSDTIGKGGDLVTGTVAGFVSDGADTFAGMLTEGAASLAQHATGGAATTGGLVTDGAGLLSGGLADPTSLQVPSLPAGVPDLTHGLPLDVPALPAAPSLPQLPDVGHLPLSLPDLPIDLPHLPVDLPSLPSVPGLPDVPSLPSLPGVDSVHDTVAGVTGNVPLVGDLTDGLTDHLPFGH